MLIRETHEAERPQVLDVVRAAFGDEGQEDADLCVSVWRSSAYMADFDLVAVEGDRLVGHVLHSIGNVSGVEVPAMAPLSVVPDRQRQGIGSSLVAESLRRAEQAGYPFVLLTGDWNYYERFGFEAAIPLGIEPVNPEDFPDLRAFMIRRLPSYCPVSGFFRYCWDDDASGGC